jgi:zinc transport system substrate-binding protein
VILFLVLVLTVSCSKQNKNEGLVITVSLPPQAWFVSQIAGDNVSTTVLVGPGQNHHNYEPTPKQIQSLASAGAWILSGADFEIALYPKISALFPDLMIVDGTYGVQFRLLEEHEHDDKDQRDVHDHSVYEVDRHTWLGREPAKILASHILDTLSVIDSDNEEYYLKNYEELIRKIDEEFDRLKIILEPLKGKSVYVYHPSFGYFLDEFGIKQEAVETGGKEPGPRELSGLLAKINKDKEDGNWQGSIFIQAQFPINAAKTLADSTGANLIYLDPLAEDWLDNIRYMGEALK